MRSVSYRPPGKDPLTNWGRFLVRRRRELDWSATQAFEAVREGLGLGVKSRSAYLPFEYDREPDDAEAAVFRDVFGGEPDEQDRRGEPTNAPDELVKAIRDQTEAINRLIERFDSLASQAIRDGVADAMKEAAALQAAATSRSGPLPGQQP